MNQKNQNLEDSIFGNRALNQTFGSQLGGGQNQNISIDETEQ